jgi:hypothetical protein
MRPLIASLLLVCSIALSAAPQFPFDPVLVLTATVSDRGANTTPFLDDVFESVFNDPSVVQITKPPEGTLGSEERTAIEFPLGRRIHLPPAKKHLAVRLVLTPQGGTGNILDAGEVGEVYGYVGDGAITVDDLTAAGKVRLATIVGPTPDGPISVPISLKAFVKTFGTKISPSHIGMMFRGQPGPGAVTFSFAGTFGGIPEDWRPKLRITYEQ